MLYAPSCVRFWVGSAFCVMRTSLGTPRAGALLFGPASRAPLPGETANGRLFFLLSPFAHASITTSIIDTGYGPGTKGRPLRVLRPTLLFYGFVEGAGV